MIDRPQIGVSRHWDIYLPLGMSTIPAGCFKLMRIAMDDLDQPGAAIATWQIISIMTLQTFGIIGMAVVVLLRMEMGMTQLTELCPKTPTFRRRRCLLISLVFLALFDIFLNVGLAFKEASPLIVLSVLWYLVYLLGIRLTFRGLQEPEHPSSVPQS